MIDERHLINNMTEVFVWHQTEQIVFAITLINVTFHTCFVSLKMIIKSDNTEMIIVLSK